MKAVKITKKKCGIREDEKGRFYKTVLEKEAKESSGIPIFTGFKRVFDIAPNQFIIQNEADGSYFTWVPVSNEIIENGFGRLNLCNDIFDEKNFNEDITDELKEIHDFIRMYGGFYMATFPASKSKKRRQYISKFVPNAEPWVNICYENSCEKTDVVREAKKYSDTLKDGAKFCIEYGELWDYTCQSLIDRDLATFDEVVKESKRLGNYYNNESGKLLKTGTKPEYMVAGLYGLAGCVWRWTQENFNVSRKVCRGGSFSNDSDYNQMFYRSSICISNGYNNLGFAGVLYGSTEIYYHTERL